ncbi:GNAT family N-acetyltransferase [Microbacterium sp. ARD32]|uniref:GNAT family N-acetyltransferase n=1 Tax=Microbacterium sp. ARD32 TaxID=2962577 RepID=UPI00288253C1|nr:GNAT family N-acetyltransferase [Microbacterium sp. ARD32]MDT0157043.1 GNAT family N-acetyltransferase [Microbacterium sp. ARD32]
MISFDSSTDAAELRDAHRTLLTPSFRPGELVPEHDFVAQLGEGGEVLLARDQDGRMLGAAVAQPFGDAVLLEYLVAAPSSRGRGVGSGLLSAFLDRWSGSVMLAEFDRPDVQSPHPVHGDPAARLRFYARFGALALDLPYFQPPVSEHNSREHGMLLAVFDRDGRIAERGALDARQQRAVQHYLHEILEAADDPDARRLRAAAEPDGLRAIPLEDYARIARSPL